uniref:Uncharacterized protein n=1 Tax=Caenorhabditis japonica TaxID=281687 RepID=A0A8R1EJ52_CAEJA
MISDGLVTAAGAIGDGGLAKDFANLSARLSHLSATAPLVEDDQSKLRSREIVHVCSNRKYARLIYRKTCMRLACKSIVQKPRPGASLLEGQV